MPTEASEVPVKPARPADDLRPRVTVAARSDKGRVRPDNQDNYVIMPLEVKTPADPNQPSNLITSSDTRYVIANRGLLLGAFDGMGGVAGGQWAAAESSKLVGTTVFDRRREVRTPTKPGYDPEDVLNATLHTTNERIHQHGRSVKPEWAGMGSTATVAWIVGKRLIIGQVGDSRAYLYHDGQLTQITKDQTLVAALIEAGVITPEQAAVHPRRTELLECLGPSEEVRPEMYEITLPRHSRLLLCSDGLYGPLSNNSAEIIKEILAQPKLPGEVCRMLVEAANARGGHDNITAIVADIDVPEATAPAKIRTLSNNNGTGYLEETPEAEEESVSEAANVEPPPPPPAQVSPVMWILLLLMVAMVVLFSVLVVREYLSRQNRVNSPDQPTPVMPSGAPVMPGGAPVMPGGAPVMPGGTPTNTSTGDMPAEMKPAGMMPTDKSS